ncbi:ABC transporter ATP-binding protein [Agrococcus carbonis]|uniref:Energy-coupling factor transport system ATP-binding protein n=1 Tax=Agrococcus carbonis TaxID=684552 RepID=A0A1H1L5D4_9MICO|nr:ABC transporter ATP-binding protein [Agrococcus carbonis]SDR69696.1 energy-coupling factor transport system ATP-binding protein [Agrococcus carbonis]
MTGSRIRARGWGWQHAGRGAPALAGLDLDVEPGERVLLLGPSGAGKSTLLGALAGVLGGEEEGDETGELSVDGAHPSSRRGIAGLVLQDPEANTIMSRVGDDVAFGCENLAVPREEIWRRVRHALDAVGLEVELDRSTAALSGGQRQRLALAGVIAMRPGLILLDEPTANLDPAGVVEVRDAVDRVARETGATLVVVEHRVETWLPVVDRVVVLAAGGGAVADGSPDQVLERHREQLAADGVWVPGLPVEVPRGGRRPADALLELDEVRAGRGGEPAHEAVSLDIRAGEALVVTGPNGAGKSTLALTIAGLMAPVAGAVRATDALRRPGEPAAVGAPGARRSRRGGEGPRDPSPFRWRPRQLATRIGTVFQQPEHQFVTPRVRQEVAAGLHALGMAPADIDHRVDGLLAALRLEALADANPFTLSGGEQRRLSVATVLAPAPRVIVLDEPTFGQDRRTWTELVRLIASLVDDRGCAVVAVTHDADVERVLGDRTLRLGEAR